jgi:hypothetical protein
MFKLDSYLRDLPTHLQQACPDSVGNIQKAEDLFGKMKCREELQAETASYNIMMYMYMMTKLNRDRALHYYEKMR